MKTVDAITHILKLEGVEYLSAFPTTPIIESAASSNIRPIICRQERVGVGIADGYSRIKNGRPPGVFAMQYGPGAENAFAGVATAYSDGVPILLLPSGHPSKMEGVFPHFSSMKSLATVTKFAERLTDESHLVDTMRRAFINLKLGRPGPVMVEIPTDIAMAEVKPDELDKYKPIREVRTMADPDNILSAARILIRSAKPMIHAGEGVLYAAATDELVELSELLGIPVMTTMGGKSAFPETHPLSLGSGGVVLSGPAYHYLLKADAVFAIGTSLTKHGMTTILPPGKTLIHSTNSDLDIGKDYNVDLALIGDAKLILRQLLEECKDILVPEKRSVRYERAISDKENVENEIKQVRSQWIGEWTPKLTSDEIPISPYRVIWDFINTVDSKDTIVTHDSGSPRDQIMPFYKSGGPRSYIGWGKSHGLGTGLGLIIGAKLASPEKLAVVFMGDAAFGMTGLDFETAVRSRLPILAIVFNNSTMAIETSHMATSHSMYGTRDIGGEYAKMALAMGGWAERIENPGEIIPAIKRAKSATENGQAALLEFITSDEQAFSHRRTFHELDN